MNQISNIRIAFIKARWHSQIIDEGYNGFVDKISSLTNNEISIEAYEVPGSFEIPLFARELATTGRYSAIVGCGLIVDGGIYRHEFVATAVINGLMTAQLESGVPMFSVVLTPKEFDDSEERQKFFLKHFDTKGREAAQSCIELLAARESLRNHGEN